MTDTDRTRKDPHLVEAYDRACLFQEIVRTAADRVGLVDPADVSLALLVAYCAVSRLDCGDDKATAIAQATSFIGTWPGWEASAGAVSGSLAQSAWAAARRGGSWDGDS